MKQYPPFHFHLFYFIFKFINANIFPINVGKLSLNPGPVFHVVCLAYNLKLGKRSIYLSLLPQLIFTVVQPHKTSFYLEEEKKNILYPSLNLVSGNQSVS